MTRVVVHRNYGNLDGFFRQLQNGFFECHGTTVHKGRNEVKVFSLHGLKVVVKKYKCPNLFNQVIYCLIRGSKARRAFRNAEKLLVKGISTPAPIGFAEERQGIFLRTAYLVTEYTDYRPVSEIFTLNGEKQDLIEQLVAFTVEIHGKGVRHDDYNLTNVLYKITGDRQCDFMLIDINRMKFKKMSRKQCLSNIRRMCGSTDITYCISEAYARQREWNKHLCLAELALQRSIFEMKKDKQNRLKKWAKQFAGI